MESHYPTRQRPCQPTCRLRRLRTRYSGDTHNRALFRLRPGAPGPPVRFAGLTTLSLRFDFAHRPEPVEVPKGRRLVCGQMKIDKEYS